MGIFIEEVTLLLLPLHSDMPCHPKMIYQSTSLTYLATADWEFQSVPTTETKPRCVGFLFFFAVEWPLSRDHQPSFERCTPPLFGDWPASKQPAPHDPSRIGPSPHSVLVAKGSLILWHSSSSFYVVVPFLLLLPESHLYPSFKLLQHLPFSNCAFLRPSIYILIVFLRVMCT